MLTKKEKAFVEIVGGVTGLYGVENYIVAKRDENFDYSELDNGSWLREFDEIFTMVYQLGLDRALEETNVS